MADDNKFAAPFVEMAERIRRNDEAEFAGAILIVPPSGDPIAVMIADPTKDAESFWAVAAAKIEIATREYQMNKTGAGQGFGQRR